MDEEMFSPVRRKRAASDGVRITMILDSIKSQG